MDLHAARLDWSLSVGWWCHSSLLYSLRLQSICISKSFRKRSSTASRSSVRIANRAPSRRRRLPCRRAMEINMTQKTTGLLSIPLLSVLLWSGCAVGPNYKRPTVDVPVTYRHASPETSATPDQSPPGMAQQSAASLGDEKWWDVFQDEQLRSLIRTALKNNYDVRIAATRVLEAQAQLGITRADQYPSVGLGAQIADQRSPRIGPIPSYELALGQVTASAAWNLDFWGRYRRATEAARANLLANEWAQKQVMATLVANVAAAYFQLRQLDLQLEISKRTYGSRSESLKLTQTQERHAPELPAGSPSVLLAERPEIRQAEQSLSAANAQIGGDRNAYFPQISR